jgi:hypothetical protein
MRLEEREKNKERKGTRWCKFYKRKKKARVNLICPAKRQVMRTHEHRRREQRKKTDAPLIL